MGGGYHVAKIHFLAGYVKSNQNMHAFAQACRAIGEPMVGKQANNIPIGKLLAQLFKVTKDFEMETQPQLLLVQKTTVVVEGLVLKLNPETNMWKLAESWMKSYEQKNSGFETRIKSILDAGKNFINTDLKEFIKEGAKYFKSVNKQEDELV